MGAVFYLEGVYSNMKLPLITVVNKTITGTIFIPVALMLAASVFFYKKENTWKKRSILFMIFLFLMIVISRLILYSKGQLVTIRYTYDLMLPSIILSVPGLFYFSDWLTLKVNKKYNINKKTIFSFLLACVFIASVGKALNPPEERYRTEAIISCINGITHGGKCLIFTAYEVPTFEVSIPGSTVKDIIDLSINGGYKSFESGLKKEKKTENCPVFVIIDSGDSKFRENFESKGLKFPLHLVKVFSDRKGLKYSLYEY